MGEGDAGSVGERFDYYVVFLSRFLDLQVID